MSDETAEPGVDAPRNDDARHAEKMAKKKVARDKIMATKNDEKGL
ncbi:MAG: cob(I)yrinic acid a,c-diamide adenosyltransferase, partial [Rhizobiaceae bacterium]|nr:cob(I)yrinic acid a,c-diamide adenosyltransferase [Rhizobiaceae bacterium]